MAAAKAKRSHVASDICTNHRSLRKVEARPRCRSHAPGPLRFQWAFASRAARRSKLKAGTIPGFKRRLLLQRGKIAICGAFSKLDLAQKLL